MCQSDFAFFCLQQAFIQTVQNDIMKQVQNLLVNDDLARIKRDEINNKDNKEKIFNRNSEENFFSLASF